MDADKEGGRPSVPVTENEKQEAQRELRYMVGFGGGGLWGTLIVWLIARATSKRRYKWRIFPDERPHPVTPLIGMLLWAYAFALLIVRVAVPSALDGALMAIEPLIRLISHVTPAVGAVRDALQIHGHDDDVALFLIFIATCWATMPIIIPWLFVRSIQNSIRIRRGEFKAWPIYNNFIRKWYVLIPTEVLFIFLICAMFYFSPHSVTMTPKIFTGLYGGYLPFLKCSFVYSIAPMFLELFVQTISTKISAGLWPGGEDDG
jgi:hypothetical protein